MRAALVQRFQPLVRVAAAILAVVRILSLVLLFTVVAVPFAFWINRASGWQRSPNHAPPVAPAEAWTLAELFELGRTPAPIGDATHQYGKEGTVIRVEGFVSKVLTTHGERVIPTSTDCSSAPGARLYLTERGDLSTQEVFIGLINTRTPSLESCPDKLAELAERRSLVRLQGVLVVHPVAGADLVSRVMMRPIQSLEVCTGTRTSCRLGLDWKPISLDLDSQTGKEKR